MRIGLVTDVPEDLVLRGLEQRVQRHRQLAGAQIGAEVPADLADRLDDVLAHLLGQLGQLLIGAAVQVLRAINPLQEAFWRLLLVCAHDVRV